MYGIDHTQVRSRCRYSLDGRDLWRAFGPWVRRRLRLSWSSHPRRRPWRHLVDRSSDIVDIVFARHVIGASLAVAVGGFARGDGAVGARRKLLRRAPPGSE